LFWKSLGVIQVPRHQVTLDATQNMTLPLFKVRTWQGLENELLANSWQMNSGQMNC
jgi:hypothetical protein